jgi:hypothetical protein
MKFKFHIETLPADQPLDLPEGAIVLTATSISKAEHVVWEWLEVKDAEAKKDNSRADQRARTAVAKKRPPRSNLIR